MTINKVPVMRPLLPKAEQISVYLRQIDESRVYSNFGPLTNQLIDRLADYFGVESENLLLVTNGTLGIQGAVATASERDADWTVPNWTFVATAQAVLSAGCSPVLEDVNLDDWVLRRSNERNSTGTIVTAPFGSAIDFEYWSEESTKRPVIIDAASCFDSFRNLSFITGLNICVMVSLHATKLVSTGEGGVLIGPKDWILEIRKWSNFGFFGDRISRRSGTNAKLSEYQAAIGLASLDEWPNTRNKLSSLFSQYISRLSDFGVNIQPNLHGLYVTSTLIAKLDSLGMKLKVSERLRKKNIETRDWWGSGLSQMPALVEYSRDQAYLNSDVLAKTTLGLPLFVDMTSAEVDHVVSTMFNE